MARRSHSRSIWPKILLLGILCLAAGGVLAVVAGGGAGGGSILSALSRRGGKGAGGTPGAKAAETRIATERAEEKTVAADAKERARLEREVERLKGVVDAKDREIADLTIQIKLLTEGSRLPTK
ncbi:MAG: hypothetical protein M1457_13285 [bacterium]|nr:hypothetical protein [bacterium]